MNYTLALFYGLLSALCFVYVDSFVSFYALQLPIKNSASLHTLSYLFSPKVHIPLSLLLLLAFAIRKKNSPLILSYAGLQLLVGTAIQGIKFCIGRARPHIQTGGDSFLPFTLHSFYHSFPSGHATVAALFAVLLCKYLPERKWIWHTCAIVLALSRVLVGKHFCSDVFFGLSIGYCSGEFLLHTFRSFERNIVHG